MRSIGRGSPPGGVDLGSYQRSNSAWGALASGQTSRSKRDYETLRRRLHQEFSGLCAYCERKVRSRRGQPGPIDHFRPRNPATGSQLSHFGAEITFVWLNLMYACSDCQNRKDNKWPGTLTPHNEGLINNFLVQKATQDGWVYAPVSVADGYIDPNQDGGTPAQDYFEYNAQDGNISPSQVLNSDHRSKALRTIFDIGLEDTILSAERLSHIRALKSHIAGKGTQREAQEIKMMVERHRRKRPSDMKDSAFGPAVRFTGLVLFASQNGWLP